MWQKQIWPGKMWKIHFKKDIEEEPMIIDNQLKEQIEEQVVNNKPFKINWALFNPFSYIKITPYLDSDDFLKELWTKNHWVQKIVKEMMKRDTKKLTKWRFEIMIQKAEAEFISKK